MAEVSITLSDESMQRLQERARQASTTPEDLLRTTVEAWLHRQPPTFAEAADYVLRKNAELYRRLA